LGSDLQRHCSKGTGFLTNRRSQSQRKVETNANAGSLLKLLQLLKWGFDNQLTAVGKGRVCWSGGDRESVDV
jgi:hypothetical protein